MTDHLKYECPNKDRVDQFKKYGNYMHDIGEGEASKTDETYETPDGSINGSLDEHETMEEETKYMKHEDAENDDTEVKQIDDGINDKDGTSDKNTNDTSSVEGLNIILGASNCTRITGNLIDSHNVLNASISGITFPLVHKTIELASQKIEEAPTGKVEHVIFNLGTNDITLAGQDADKVRIAFTEAITATKAEFHDIPIGVCSILPRKGNSNKIKTFNDTTHTVNSFICKMCEKDEQLTYINLNDTFLKHGIPIKTYYVPNDNTGVHISTDGAKALQQRLFAFSGLTRT